jgi:hypothetical protein
MDGMGAFSAFREQIEHLEILMQLFIIQVGSAMLCHHFFALSCPDKEESPYAMLWRIRVMTSDVNGLKSMYTSGFGRSRSGS